ncbi:MAG: anthranilate phosphoribosyltransferase, partial [Candidatus Omnitrophica bacterium]|nr:anthranilate phosphoribosyltransferase [Candidatus Omnitrophota bacterium]
MNTSESQRTFLKLFKGQSKNDFAAGQILTLLSKKGEHANELTGFVRAVRQIEKPRFKTRIPYLVDNCGTGGDGAGTFNISTVSSFVAAGAGAHVAKHGNRSVSSQCGSADLLMELDVKIDAPPQRMLKALEKGNIGYFHAPLYHPAFKKLQPIRHALGRKKIKTIFNLAGPLLNPLWPRRQVIGVYRKDLLPIIAQAIKKMNLAHAIIVWNYDGIDELTTTNKSLLVEIRRRKQKTIPLMPKVYGFKKAKLKDLKGGNPSVNRKIALQILEGRDVGPKRDAVLLNAGAVLYASGRAKSLKEGIKLARLSIKSEKAIRALKQ